MYVELNLDKKEVSPRATVLFIAETVMDCACGKDIRASLYKDTSAEIVAKAEVNPVTHVV